MGLLGAISFSLALVFLTQIPYSAAECKILSAKSSGPSSILVKWEMSDEATNYVLDLRVINNTNIAPVVVSVAATSTQKDVHGLRPGTEYNVTLKIFHFYYIVCRSSANASTVPAASQIIDSQALSSTSVMVNWTEVPSADYYYLLIESQSTGTMLNLTYTNTSSVVENLQPFTNYNCSVITANKAGEGPKSKKRMVTTLYHPPVNVTVTRTGQGTARVTWQPVEGVLLYKVVVQDIDEPTGLLSAHNTSATELDVQGILPCSTYLISVSSFNNFLVPSEPTVYTYTTSKLRPVETVSVDYTCATQSAEVHWTAVFGADSYEAIAMGDNGTQLMCTSQSTMCQITGLSCSQSYVVYVTPITENCHHMMNTTFATFQTVPCPPKNLELLTECSSNAIIFSWEYTNNTDYYLAQAVDSKGVVQECLTEDNSCYFTHTLCGHHYFFTVYSITGQCRSQVSSTVDIRTAPCIPQNLQTSADCNSDVLLSKWDLAEGALYYYVEAFGNRGNQSTYNCSSMSNSCAIEGVHCGEYLTIYITAIGYNCSSPRTLGPVAETVPCIPHNIMAVRECGADAITMTWSLSGSALFYVAMAKDIDGVIHSCNSMDLTCKIEGLMCSTNYTAYVIASNFMCNSTESEMVTIETGACPPDQVTASVDCAANEALISWHGQPEIKSYTATIVDEDQVLLSCSSTNTSCRVPNLKCDQLYTVTVSHHDGMCPSMPSEAIYMGSVPCGPNVDARLDCPSQVLTLSWNQTSGAEGYEIVVSENNNMMSYNTTEPGLTITTLECGLSYALKVMSFNSTCVSRPTMLSIRETPCVPTNVTAMRVCGQSSVEVTWNASRGALHYKVTAVDKDGQSLMCSSNDTLCMLEGLMCSQIYSVGVTAMDNTCTSNESSVETLQTAPCPPSGLTVSVNCTSNSAMLTWRSSPNAVSYTGKAVSADGDTMTCNAGMNLSCQLDDLQCGQEYTFTVSASDGDCQSPDSEPVIHTTAPCAPESVLSNLNCSTNVLIIRWAPASMPLNYSATALAGDGTALHCLTEGSNCTLTNLQCGQQYSVTVKGISSTCEGHSSMPQIVNSVPCVPGNVQGDMECYNNTLLASWDAADGALSYISTLYGAGGFSASCPTSDQRCLFPDLQCAQSYMFSVVALNNMCNSSESDMISTTTAPCDPTNVTAALHCLSAVVTVTWGDSAGANYYKVIAKANGHIDSCHSNSTSCELTQLQCGENYTVTVLAGDGKCNSSTLAKTSITTAPCAPVIQDHSLDCASNHAVVTWVEDDDALIVSVEGTSQLGHWVSCNSSTNSSCVMDELLCGHIYTVQAVAEGVQCLSTPSSSFQIVTAPCTPTFVTSTYSCESGIAILSWDDALGSKGYYSQVDSGDPMCNTDDTSCSLPSLLCGRTYNVSVTTVGDHCNSSMSDVTQVQTAPCAPMNVSTSLVCDNNTVAVTWQHSPGAVYYEVVALGSDNDIKQCTTNGTSCLMPNMHCAQTYVVIVTPFSYTCRGASSEPYAYVAGPCPPTDVHVSLQCVGNMGHVTWTAAPQADLYMATAVLSSMDEHNYTCVSNGTSCHLTDLYCGKTAVVTVVTIERGCMSKPSLPFTFQSVICPPTSLTGVTTCSNNDITVSWDPSPESGVNYIVHSQKDGWPSTNFSTSQTSHVLTGLQCGELYTLTVAAKDNECTSNLSEPIQTETAPCPPTNLTVKADCGTNLGKLTWAPSTHAISYTATVTGTHGHVVSCSSNTTTCSVKLECGRSYSAVVVASSATCNSSAGAPLTFDSAPCLPDNVVADLDCNVNSFAVQWRATLGDIGTYTAVAIGSDNSRAFCDSASTNCTIENLTCGLTYSIVVTTSSVDCGTIEGSDYLMQSAACKPEGVSVDLECSTNIALVTWGNSGPDQTQVVTAMSSIGMTTTCNSTSSNCTLNQLTCGESYDISVVGHTNTCSSEPAVAETLNTAPCVPTFLTAEVFCLTNIVVVTWDSALGATDYTVYVRGNLGHNTECNTTDTNCDFTDLACGQEYNITVVARHLTCISLVSETIKTSTGPCPHKSLKPTLDCETNTAMVSWIPGSGILYYNATASAFGVDHESKCSSNGSSCNISSLLCGQSYRVVVDGQGKMCASPHEEWHQINTAPCPPTQLKVNSSCESNNISVSWQASQGSVSYKAVAEDAQGHRWWCDTDSTTCQISGLLCGQQYQVYVTGLDEECTGAMSDVEVIHTAPCVPWNIQNNLDCLSGVLNVTWESTGNVSEFRAYVVSSEGNFSVCQTNEHHCVAHNMQCGLTYNVTVVAQDEACNSSHSPPEQVLTAPCPLPTFLPAVNCTTGVVSVTWNNSVAGVMYMVWAVDATGRQHNCSGTDSGCNLSMLECGMEYNVTITPSRDGCVGRNSPTKKIKTVPCIPHLSQVEIDCLTNSAWVMYEESAGAEEYVAMAMDSQGDVKTFECNTTSDGMCALPPLMCSQNLTFTLKAHDQQCPSAPSNAVTTETAPCPPENIEITVGCDNRTASFDWPAIPGAVAYTATLEQISGGSYCCTTPDTGCDIGNLPCGEMYVLFVVAEGRMCNSSQSNGDILRTVPCVPTDLKANLSCSDNVATMSWEHSLGGQLYRVRAVGTDGHVDECSSFTNQCDLTGLRCGQYYTATVMAEDRDCRSNQSDSVSIKTVPCTPANVSSVIDCEYNTLTASWSDSPGADSYIATLQDSSGQTTTCLGTTEGFCNVTGVGCGQIYSVSVVSSDGYCNSPATPVVETPSVPCKPRDISAVMDCYLRTATVAWFPSDGALSYMVMATSVWGHNVTCESNFTHCELEGLLCGQSYSVSVKAVGWTCCSTAQMEGQLVTDPCIPGFITTLYSSTIGQVLWDEAAGADNYSVEAVTEQGLIIPCTTDDTYCALPDLGCGQTFNVSVTANNNVCQGISTSTESATITTEPCPPNNVQTSVQCQNNIGVVTWEPSIGAVGYEASLNGGDYSLSCFTNNTFCNVEGLQCGIIYFVNVIAIGWALNSSMSSTVQLVSAPCAPGNVAASLDCYNNTAEVSWSSISGKNYVVTAVGMSGHWTSCETSEQQCELSELQCGEMYTISLTTISDHCQIDTLTNVTFSTRPCKPLRVGVDLQCGMSTANMYWEDREGVELYMATATCNMGMTLQCNSTNSTCQFSNLDCGKTYEFSVIAYSSSMCYSEVSSTAEIQTGPCQPTGLTVSGSCDNETVVMDWSAAKGALAYVVTVMGDLGYTTSFQTNETTVEANLTCGQLFTFLVKSQDDRCDSAVSLPEEFKTRPCMPEHVQSTTQCEDSVGVVHWAESDGADSYLAFAVGMDGHTHVCTSNTTSCTWDDLHCGEEYTVHIIANDFQCSSMLSSSISIRMAPCSPQNVESSLNCTTKVGLLTWNASATAEFYIVTAENNSGQKIGLSTNDTWAFISEFVCGQEYFLSVQAVDSVCRSQPSQPSRLDSEPCPPTGVTSSVNCVSNIAVVSWTNSAGAEFYIATLTLEDESLSCWSDSAQCGIPNTRCGQNYTVTVVASTETCSSDPSEADTLQSVPCVPADVAVMINCSDNQAVVSWSASEGALSYRVMAQSTLGSMSDCESTNLTCTLTNLTCGQDFSVQVVAEDDICSSLPSPAVKFNSVPCIPKIGSVVLDCFTNSALVNWTYAMGALSYTATAWSSSGHFSTCYTNFTNCEVKDLQCGQTYNVTIEALNEGCSSPTSSWLQVESVPCPPENVITVVNCSTNTARVEWQASRGADSYIVKAVVMQEDESWCETNLESCVLPSLKCGFTYNVSVIALNSVCNVSQSNMTQIQAVPCVPQQVEAWVDCESGDVAVSWEPSKGASSYTTVAQGNGGYASMCNSNETTCLFNDLLCGLNYTITVSASDETCSSAGSSAVELSSVPCVPQNVTAEMVCSNDTGIVSWEEGEGVTSYMVQAFGPDGHKTECNSTATSCQLPDMHCGQLYNLTVTAQDGQCGRHAYLDLQSVPCSPTFVKAALRCQSNSVAVTWERASGALSYLAVGVTADGSHQTECNNTMPNCDLSDVQCGQTYNVSVFGQDESCSSVESDKAYVRTAPCTPQDVVVDIQCDDGVMTVSWSPNADAQYFNMMAVSNTGERLHCNSSSTNCTISDLPCGQNYNVTVMSVRDGCESKPSAVMEAATAPCVPMNPEGHLDCVTNSAWVTWDASEGALTYFVLAEGDGGYYYNCTTTSSPCNVPDLKCGTVFTFHVTAMNNHCRSNHSTTFELETGPCALTSISAMTECNSNSILVEWEMTEDMPLYLVTAESHDQRLISCNSSSNSCLLHNIECGMHYSIIVSASSDKCSNLRSPPKKIKTAPCAPDNVTVVASCEDNGATVTWELSPVATSYLVTVTGRDGHDANCSSSVNNCTLADLHCGQPYIFSITASGDNCTSQPSTTSFTTVPCEPSGLSVDIDCETNSAELSWGASEGAVQYYGCAQPMEGEALYCNSTSTLCTIEGLHCGGIYNFSVEASDGVCNSSFSAPLQAGAAPCAPTGLNVYMQKIGQTHWTMISWDSVNCSDVEYLVEITGRIQNSPQALMEVSSYWLPMTYFELPMPCSTAYNVTVTSRNSAGVSEPSRVFTGVTVPCTPQNFKYTGDTESAELSWDASVFATRYTVYSVSPEGRSELCSTTTELSCLVTNFNPNNTEVTASNAEGESIPNRNITGPVEARRRRDLLASEFCAQLDKELGIPKEVNITAIGVSLVVEWKTVKCATAYTVVIQEKYKPNQRFVATPVVENFYEKTGLKPRTTYCVRLAAKTRTEQSSYSDPKCLATGDS